jgi:hypothetical protein
MQMIKAKSGHLNKRSQRFLEQLIFTYKILSQDHHLSAASIVRVYGKLLIEETDPRRASLLKSIKDDNITLLLTVLLAVYSEINDICRFDRGTALAYCWRILVEYRSEAEDLYRVRYRAMLQKRYA